jgi:hypothetical protein
MSERRPRNGARWTGDLQPWCKAKAVITDMERMSSDNSDHDRSSEGELLRRRGDRRVHDAEVADDRRKGDRRETPGIAALMQTLLKRDTGEL